MRLEALFSIKRVFCFALVVCGLVMAQVGARAAATVSLNPATQPPSGLAGTGVAYILGYNFPAGLISPSSVTVSLAGACMAAPVATATATQVMTIPFAPVGAVRRIAFVIPGTLATGTYAVWVTGSDFTSSDCSSLMVTGTTKTVASCIPSSALALALGTTVTAYIPKGAWDRNTIGIGVVNIEGPTGSSSISTPGAVNACSSNAITGETVCTANDNDVYLITGTTLNKTLTSGANTSASFSGGSCKNCGVAIDAANNTAYIEEGITGGSGQGVQALNLGTNTFASPFPMHFRVSENIAIDPFLNYVLTPGEDDNYTILQIAPSGTLTEFGERSIPGGGGLDSAAEDCTTGIALASQEGTNNVFIEDLTQAVFTPGTPGSYTASGQDVTLVGTGFSAGTSGISVAPGSSHLGVVTGEFGGNTFAVLQLPSTSGSGTPTISDYAYTHIPANPAGAGSPCASGFNAGTDPHTVSAYTSPTDNRAFGVFAGNSASCLVVVDLAAVLGAPRNAGTHTVTTPPPSAFSYFAIP